MEPNTNNNHNPREQTISADELMDKILAILKRNQNVWFLSWVYIRAQNLEKLVHNN